MDGRCLLGAERPLGKRGQLDLKKCRRPDRLLTAPGTRSSSKALPLVHSRPLTALMKIASAPAWSPRAYASSAGSTCVKKASRLGTEISDGSSSMSVCT